MNIMVYIAVCAAVTMPLIIPMIVKNYLGRMEMKYLETIAGSACEKWGACAYEYAENGTKATIDLGSLYTFNDDLHIGYSKCGYFVFVHGSKSDCVPVGHIKKVKETMRAYLIDTNKG